MATLLVGETVENCTQEETRVSTTYSDLLLPTGQNELAISRSSKNFSVFGHQVISDVKEKETRRVQNLFDQIIKAIERRIVSTRTEREVVREISSYLSYIDLSLVVTFKKIFLALKATLKWHSVEDLDNIYQQLNLNGITELDKLRVQYKHDLKEYFTKRVQSVSEAGATTSLRTENHHPSSFVVYIDRFWNREDLRGKCDEICRKIMTILGKPTNVYGDFKDPELHIRQYLSQQQLP